MPEVSIGMREWSPLRSGSTGSPLPFSVGTIQPEPPSAPDTIGLLPVTGISRPNVVHLPEEILFVGKPTLENKARVRVRIIDTNVTYSILGEGGTQSMAALAKEGLPLPGAERGLMLPRLSEAPLQPHGRLVPDSYWDSFIPQVAQAAGVVQPEASQVGELKAIGNDLILRLATAIARLGAQDQASSL